MDPVIKMENILKEAVGKLDDSFIIEKPAKSIFTLVKKKDSDLIVKLSVSRGPTHYVCVNTNITGEYKMDYTRHKKSLTIFSKILAQFKKCEELKGRIKFYKDDK